MNKPDRQIFEHLIQQFEIEPATAVFIDDSPTNIEAARGLGFRVIQFTDARGLRRELVRLGSLRVGRSKTLSADDSSVGH